MGVVGASTTGHQGPYARKRAAGKSTMNALGHCMRKALSLVWGVWRNGRDFDPDWRVDA